jgi:copper(I)-binding protein
MGMADAMATYLVVSNSGSAPDALVGVASDVARTVQLHETVVVSPSPGASGMGMASPSGGAMMAMRPVAKVEVPAAGSIELKPGGYHIMLMGMLRQLKPGDTFTVTLTFEKAGTKSVTVEVRAS